MTVASILVADDDAHIVRVMTIWLRRHGHHVVTAGNGREAVERLEEGAVDVIISDMNMPLLDGVGLAREVRTKLRSSVPILMLTARCDQERLTADLAPHSVRVLPKPFLPSQLVAEINSLLSPVAK
jgi:CheY-like chemotaxis protein